MYSAYCAMHYGSLYCYIVAHDYYIHTSSGVCMYLCKSTCDQHVSSCSTVAAMVWSNSVYPSHVTTLLCLTCKCAYIYVAQYMRYV